MDIPQRDISRWSDPVAQGPLMVQVDQASDHRKVWEKNQMVAQIIHLFSLSVAQGDLIPKGMGFAAGEETSMCLQFPELERKPSLRSLTVHHGTQILVELMHQ
jgi:hypothetical protein